LISAPPDSLAVFKGPISKGREEKEEEGKGGGEKGRGGEGEGCRPQLGSLDPPVL